jgi:hypothetical protein
VFRSALRRLRGSAGSVGTRKIGGWAFPSRVISAMWVSIRALRWPGTKQMPGAGQGGRDEFPVGFRCHGEPPSDADVR